MAKSSFVNYVEIRDFLYKDFTLTIDRDMYTSCGYTDESDGDIAVFFFVCQ